MKYLLGGSINSMKYLLGGMHELPLQILKMNLGSIDSMGWIQWILSLSG
jgi:hypothetical protein